MGDAEVMTMEIVGEFLSNNSDKTIWAYFKEHWFHFFPKIGCRTSFSRQCENLDSVKKQLQIHLSEILSVDQDLFLYDGFPIPICHIKRSTSSLIGEGSVGYCAAKDDKYFGFKGHILITQHGSTVAYEVAPAHIDERDVLPEIAKGLSGMLLADKGFIRPKLTIDLATHHLNLQTPLRKNRQD